MTDSRAAVGLDRLPWLLDEPKGVARVPGRGRELAGWAVAATLAIAGGSYWLGTQMGDRPAGEEPRISTQPQSTVQLPQPRDAAPASGSETFPQPEVRPAPVPTVTVAEPAVTRPERSKSRGQPTRRKLSPMDMSGSDLSKTVAEQEAAPPKREATKAVVTPPRVKAAPTARPLARAQQLKLWPSRQASGASGRLVQIGAFGSRQQAKLGWRRMTRSYPAVGRLPAVVVESRNSRGKRFYRFQIGTTSQAHSEVLCQRMARIRYSCAVVGLPWKSKVER